MINLIHITAKGMQAMRNAHAVACRSASMVAAVGVELNRVFECCLLSVQPAVKPAFAANGGSNSTGFAYGKPHDRYDNSHGKARLKLR